TAIAASIVGIALSAAAAATLALAQQPPLTFLQLFVGSALEPSVTLRLRLGWPARHVSTPALRERGRGQREERACTAQHGDCDLESIPLAQANPPRVRAR